MWNKYQGKFPLEFFVSQLLRVADMLYEAGLYLLARSQGYRRCLVYAGLQEEGSEVSSFLELYLPTCETKGLALAMVGYRVQCILAYQNLDYPNPCLSELQINEIHGNFSVQ